MISVRLMGGLGNQMFQVAAAIGLANKLGVEFGIYDELKTKKLYSHNHFKGRAPIPAGYQPKRTFKEQPDQEYHELPLEDDICLEGYFQSYKYFEHCVGEARRFFKLPYEIIQPEDFKPYVGIHVRRGDYLKYPKIFPILDEEYYMKAIKFFWDKGYREYEVFSDEPKSAQNLITYCFSMLGFGGNVKIHQDNPVESDFLNLLTCPDKIIANSTFSAMAALLSPNPKQIVIRPKKWLHTKAMTHILPKTENYIEI